MKCTSLYQGLGSADLGLRAAGFDHDGGIDINREACITAQFLGFHSSEVDLLRWRSFPPIRHYDLIWLSPPCPDFSKAGQGEISQVRRAKEVVTKGGPVHIHNTMEFLLFHKPTWAVIENVTELAKTAVYVELMAALLSCFPESASVELDAKDFGVAQTRRRLIVLAGPTASKAKDLLAKQPLLSNPVSMGDVLGYDLESWLRREPGRKVYSSALTGRELDSRWLHRPSPTVTCQEVKGTRASANGKTPWHFNGGPDRASDAAFLALGVRRLSWEEAAMLQGFHQTDIEAIARAPVSDAARYRLIGNAVPRSMAEAIGRAILNSF